MGKPALLLLLAAIAPLAFAANGSTVQKVNVEQLTTLLAAANGKTDSELAQELEPLQLTERLSTDKLTAMEPKLPGEKSKHQLLILADSAAFLDLPSAEIPQKAMPDASALRQMLVQMVGYVNATLHRLPNLVATRETSAFEDRPAEDVQEEDAVVSLSFLPLHLAGQSSAEVAYRDGHDTDLTKLKAAQHQAQVRGLLTAGEFGSFPRTVLADAIKGKITWGHWEQGGEGLEAAFHYAVPKNDSHYLVQFCCVTQDESESFATHIYSEHSGYHGEIDFDPTTGSILRIAVEADPDPGGLIASAGMVVEYGPEQIGTKTVIVPKRSISLLEAHITRPRDGLSHPTFSGKPKTYLNDTTFANYHEFRGEVRIVAGENAVPPQR